MKNSKSQTKPRIIQNSKLKIPNCRRHYGIQISSFSAQKKFNEKVRFRKNSPPTTRVFSFLKAKNSVFFSKSSRFIVQYNSHYTTKRPLLHHKPTPFVEQNDRNCYAKRPLLHLRSRRFLAHFSSTTRNTHCTNRLSLHTNTWQKTDREFYFSFSLHSQRVNNANIVQGRTRRKQHNKKNNR